MASPASYLNIKISGLRKIIVAIFLFFLLIVFYTHYKGWSVIIELKRVDTQCDTKGSCTQWAYLNDYGHRLEITDGTVLHRGDIINVNFSCSAKGCRPDSWMLLKSAETAK